MKPLFWVLIALSMFATVRAQSTTSSSPATNLPRPTVTLSTAVEDGKKQLVAKVVTQDGKPIEDVTVGFYAKRSFGELLIGQEKTLDDGTAAVPFPSDLPGTSSGEIQFTARVKASDKTGSAEIQAALGGGVVAPEPPTELPRALWSSRAPLANLAIVGAAMAIVWLTYGYIVVQILGIRKGART